jgi:ELP3 family radical SAM enzyme/protein acetyltransferase
MSQSITKNIEDIEDIIPNNSMKKVSHLLVRDLYKNITKEKITLFTKELISELQNIEKIGEVNKHTYSKIYKELRKKHSINPNTVSLNYTYYKLLNEEGYQYYCSLFEKNVKAKKSRSNSGITQITVLSSPYPNGQKFSCEYDCYYCPKEPAHEGNGFVEQPRSYLYNEPAVRRANSNGFDAANQMWDRMSALMLCGLKIDKLEVMVLGGTWGSYPEDYRTEFIRDLYYAANTFFDDMDNKRERLSLEEEITLNMTLIVRIIGLTLETRPDYITARELELFRKYNCTRVQIGVQHTDKRILSKINRGCYLEDTKRAIKNLMDIGLKVDVHLMFDLPYAEYEDDIKMINTMYRDPDLQFDQVKFYPFQSVDWTKTKEWEDKGMNLHYTPQELFEILIYAQQHIKPWIRINRVIRDIPTNYILDGNDVPNLRQELDKEMQHRGIQCQCIRCREVKNNKEALEQIDNAKLFVRTYKASGGTEYFISIESQDNRWIYGFCRLRLSNDMGKVQDIAPTIHRNKQDAPNEVNLFPKLNDCAMIRELHVYGSMDPVNNHNNMVQHRGFGKKLIKKAEQIAWRAGYSKISVISGVGVRQYYAKRGYELEDSYMVKYMTPFKFWLLIIFIIVFNFIYY